MSDPKVVVYTMDFCPYCTRAKHLLKSRGVPFKEILLDRSQQADEWQSLMKRSGMRTLPQIFNGDELIGGYTELADLDSEKGLDHLR